MMAEHDLVKDPMDIPKESKSYLCKTEIGYCVLYFYGNSWGFMSTFKNGCSFKKHDIVVLAWED